MNLFSLAGLLLAITCFTVAIIVLIYGRTRLHRVWLLCNIAISIWGIGTFLVGRASSEAEAVIFWRIAHLGGVSIAAFFYHMACLFSEVKRKKTIVFVYAQLIFFQIINLTTNLFISQTKPFFGLYYAKSSGLLYPLAFLIWCILVCLGHWELIKYYRQARGVKRTQAKYLFVGFLVGFLGGTSTLLPIFGINIYPFGNLTIPLYSIIVTYAILRHRLLDVNLVITRAGIFAIVYAVVLGLPFVAIRWLEPIFGPLWGHNWWIAILALGMGLASAGPFIYMYFQRRATAYLLREERRTHDLLIKASMGLANIRELKRLLGIIVNFITKTLHTENAAIYLLDKEEQEYKLESVRYKSIFHGMTPIESKDPLIELLKETRQPIVLEEIKTGPMNTRTNEIIAQMKNLSSTVIIPSFIEETLLGFLALDEKKSGNVYTRDDLEVLSVLSNQAALAIENAVFYEEQGKTLAQQFQEHRLRSLGKMGSGIGHQINNRFQAIAMTAGSSQMLDVEELKKSNLSDEQKKLLDDLAKSLNDIVQECMRGGNIARSLTQFSRTQEDFKPVALRDILEGTISLLSCKFNIEEINLSLDYPHDGPPLFGNLALLQDIFFNHLDNARDACLTKKEEIDKGVIKRDGPYAPKVSVSAQPKDGYWHIEIKDNGIGMTEEQLDQAFIPFFTTKATSSKGTGLGLSIIKKIIDAHKGTIAVQSKYGEGTAFSITLPIS